MFFPAIKFVIYVLNIYWEFSESQTWLISGCYCKPLLSSLCINMSDYGRCLWADSMWRWCVLPFSVLNPFCRSLGLWQILRWKAFSPPIRTPSTSSRVSPSPQGESAEWSDYINTLPVYICTVIYTFRLWPHARYAYERTAIISDLLPAYSVMSRRVFFITVCHIPVTCWFFFL